MHMLIPHNLRIDLTADDTSCPGVVTVSKVSSSQLNRRGWPVVSKLRTSETKGHGIVVTLSHDVNQIRSMLHLLQQVPPESKAVVVCDGEPIPQDMRDAFPLSLHALLRRPQPTDLTYLSAEILDASSESESVLGAALRNNAISLALPGPVEASRLPDPGPGSPTVDLAALRSAIDAAMADASGSAMHRKCVESGLLLLWDFLDESHAISQTMEGKGTPRTADYWHAIMHRREPDLGNAAYWFRRVGNHPAFESMGSRLPDWLRDTSSPAEEPSRALDSGLESGTFAPLAMIELCRAAQQTPSTAAADSYRRIQYLELLNLLLHPYSRTSGAG